MIKEHKAAFLRAISTRGPSYSIGGGDSMTDLRSMTAALIRQRQRLAELVEICGGIDQNHPLQRYSIRRIAWLEERIAEKKA